MSDARSGAGRLGKKMADIIVVEDERVLRRTLARSLSGRGHDTRAAETAEEALEMLAEGPPDLIITDHRLPGMTGHALLEKVKEDHPATAVIVITAHGTIEDAVAAMREGAADYLRKPVDLDELQILVQRCLANQGQKKELAYYRTRDLGHGELDGFVGASAAMQELRGIVRRVAGLQKKDGIGPTVLLQGETGTGKGLVARAIHKVSPRAEAPLIEVNCTAIPEHLLEAELMGYEKGAFTDASVAKPGLLEAAEGGTIFFDEIGHMSDKLQAKLLKIIEDRVVRRLGSTRDRKTRCSIITATHMDLESKVAEGEFREDLYHRINVAKVTLPPLREREDDVEELAEFFTRTHAADYSVEAPTLSAEAMAAIRRYPWPGNIRELSHAIERAIVMKGASTIEAADLGLGRAKATGASLSATAGGIEVDFAAGPLAMDEIEETLLRRALAHAGNSKTEAGRLLGISRDTFRYRLAKYEAASDDG